MMTHTTDRPDSQGYHWKMEDGKLWYHDPLDKRWYLHYWASPESRIEYYRKEGRWQDAFLLHNLIRGYRMAQFVEARRKMLEGWHELAVAAARIF
jgi:hypothetical protein